MSVEEQRSKELADFLKSRRARIQPAQVGLPVGRRRRTPGLRREEVAQLAGIGVTWYTYLEQGRPIHVSSQIVESLSRVLRLDKYEQIYLFTLANQPIPSDYILTTEGVSQIMQNVLDNLPLCPSFIMDQRWNVLAWNKAACKVFGDFAQMNLLERNMVWRMFTNADYKSLFVNWELHAQGMVGRFRQSCGQNIKDSWFMEFAETLIKINPDFDLYWSKHDINANDSIDKQLMHPLAGEMLFEFSSFDVSDFSGRRLIINTPSSEDTIAKMKSLL